MKVMQHRCAWWQPLATPPCISHHLGARIGSNLAHVHTGWWYATGAAQQALPVQVCVSTRTPRAHTSTHTRWQPLVCCTCIPCRHSSRPCCSRSDFCTCPQHPTRYSAAHSLHTSQWTSLDDPTSQQARVLSGSNKQLQAGRCAEVGENCQSKTHAPTACDPGMGRGSSTVGNPSPSRRGWPRVPGFSKNAPLPDAPGTMRR